MSTMSTRFPYKERRVGKNPKIALTRSSSTPSNPYGSRAEACQPETMISAARQGMGMIPFPRTQPVKQGRLRIGSLIFRNVPIREEEDFLLSSFYRGRRGVARSPATIIVRCRSRGHDPAMQQKSPVGVDMPQPYCE